MVLGLRDFEFEGCRDWFLFGLGLMDGGSLGFGLLRAFV